MSRVRRPRDGPEAVRRHIQLNHPSCPEELKAIFEHKIIERSWRVGDTNGRAFGIIATNHVRHRMTSYEQLLRIAGVTRDEAHLIVSDEVEAIMAVWKQKA